MFTSMTAGQLPKFETRKALIIINIQNDSFDTRGGFVVCHPQDFVDRIKAMVPYFRRMGDLVWVRTEFQMEKSNAVPGVPRMTDDKHMLQEDDIQQTAALSLEDKPGSSDLATVQEILTTGTYFPSSRTKAVMRRASAKTRAEQRNDQLQSFTNDDANEDIDAYLSKPRKGQPPRLYVPGTGGANFTDGIRPFVEEDRDMVLIKNHYSAFDATPLLLSLRMRLVTHLYLCGCLSNISIYATAADAVRHGFEVTVVEDCMGYRSEAKHLDAMRQMADMLGVSGIDSEEIIDEVGAQEPPDAEVPIFTGPGIEGINPPRLLPVEGMEFFRPKSRNFDRQTEKLDGQDDSVAAPSAANTVDGNTGQCLSTGRLDASTEENKSTRSHQDTPAIPDAQLPESRKTALGPGDRIGEGDSRVLHTALSPSLAKDAFKLVKKEVDWQAMRHRSGEVPRKVAVQGDIDSKGNKPLYRHPADESPPLLQFSATVQRIREEVQKLLRQPFNHALIQLYRNGQDNISEHSDKTLDIVRGSSIVNVSLGAQRVMTLRTKKPRHSGNTEVKPAVRRSQRIQLPHNSVFVLGLQTNCRWLHGIRPDKRQAAEKTREEKAFDGERISITFRHIGTFTDKITHKIWGQGAVSKYPQTAGTVSTSNSAEMDAMIVAFGKENQQVNFDWDAEYGGGFDVVNLVSSVTQLYIGDDNIANLRVMLSIFERDVPCEISRGKRTEPSDNKSSSKPKTIFALSGDENPVFRDIDDGSSEIIGDLAILFYLGRFYPIVPSGDISARQLHRLTSYVFSRVTQANEILFLWQELRGSAMTASTRGSHSLRRSELQRAGTEEATILAQFQGELEIWEEYAEETEYVGGDFYALVDCAFWPVLNEIVEKWDGWDERRYPDLAAYHSKVASMPSVQKALSQAQRLSE